MPVNETAALAAAGVLELLEELLELLPHAVRVNADAASAAARTVLRPRDM